MSARENTNAHDLHALLRQLQARNASPGPEHYDMNAWQRAKDLVHKAQAKAGHVLSRDKTEHALVDKHAKNALI
jgi:hypothetical protein